MWLNIDDNYLHRLIRSRCQLDQLCRIRGLRIEEKRMHLVLENVKY